MKLLRHFTTAVLTLTCMAAFAQWQWIDKDGRKVFSDRAPPPDIQDKNILKRPLQRSTSAASSNETAQQDPSNTSPNTGAPISSAGAGVDKELEAKKKQAAEAEIAKRKAEEEARTKAKIENCARAKQGKATYDSGVRIVGVNANGQKEFLDDAARAAELKRIQSIIDSDCK